jgi:hypothetical protein
MEAYNVVIIGANAGRGTRSAARASSKRVLLRVWGLTPIRIGSGPHSDTRKEISSIRVRASGHAASLTRGEQ